MTNFSNIHSNNRFLTALCAVKPACLVNIQQTSLQNADPLDTDLRCENEVHWLDRMQNALSTILAFSHPRLLGSAPITKTSLVDFIVTLCFRFFK